MKQLQALKAIIESNTQHTAPVTRKFIDPEDWIDVCVGIGNDHTASITLHKDDYEALKELTNGG